MTNSLQPGQTGTLRSVLELCKFIENNNVDVRFRGDLVVFTPRPAPQSDVEYAKTLAAQASIVETVETGSANGELPIQIGRIVEVYADGGVVTDPLTGHFNPSPVGGTWAWCHVDEFGQRVNAGSGFISADEAGMAKGVTNNLTEMLAVVKGIEALPSDWVGTVCSDSAVTLGRLFLSHALNELPQWLIVRIGAMLRSHRMAEMTVCQLDGHPTRAQLQAGIGKRGHRVSEHNVWCDKACTEAGRLALAARAGAQ